MNDIPSSKIRDRLRAVYASLERIDLARRMSGDPHFGRALEERLVRRELFDLELQELDEQLAHICESGWGLAAGLPQSSVCRKVSGPTSI